MSVSLCKSSQLQLLNLGDNELTVNIILNSGVLVNNRSGQVRSFTFQNFLLISQPVFKLDQSQKEGF